MFRSIATNPFIIPTKRKMKSAHCEVCSIDFVTKEFDDIALCYDCTNDVIDLRLQNLKAFLREGVK